MDEGRPKNDKTPRPEMSAYRQPYALRDERPFKGLLPWYHPNCRLAHAPRRGKGRPLVALYRAHPEPLLNFSKRSMVQGLCSEGRFTAPLSRLAPTGGSLKSAKGSYWPRQRNNYIRLSVGTAYHAAQATSIPSRVYVRCSTFFRKGYRTRDGK